ncbi:MAG: hypothetical protein H6821_12275 [Planctomycetaceae bacterium]|nr:hypothetical protein [Planctomycetales bacterium]MCB9874945.1 hypothetical protein [Planctomycetaceae bacterium]MCB9939400.1 hypothetical protein [Planctomycetaceae bacterium]HRX83357.1 hypothetical protein [Pirellulaceae bacterium]
MKKRNIPTQLFTIGLAVTMLLLIVSRSTTTAAVNAQSIQWEHLAMSVDATNGIGDGDTSSQIVRLGNEGWELVGVESIVIDGTTTKLAYFFKRPKA